MASKSGIGATAVQMAAAGAIGPGAGVVVKAFPGQSGVVWVGYANTVTAGTADATDGFPLEAGASYVVTAGKIAQNLSNVWLVASGATGQAVAYDVLTG